MFGPLAWEGGGGKQFKVDCSGHECDRMTMNTIGSRASAELDLAVGETWLEPTSTDALYIWRPKSSKSKFPTPQ